MQNADTLRDIHQSHSEVFTGEPDASKRCKSGSEGGAVGKGPLLWNLAGRLPYYGNRIAVVFGPPAFVEAVCRQLRPRLRVRFQNPIASLRW